MHGYFTAIRAVIAPIFFTCMVFAASNVAIDKQAFAGEDLLILRALDAQQLGQYQNAASFYEELYKKSGRGEYLKNSIKLFLTDDNISTVGNLIQEGLEAYPKDFDYRRFNIAKLLKENNVTAAKQEALKLAGQESNEQNLRLLGAIYLYLQEYDLALKYLNDAYAFSKNEQVMLQIVDINLKTGKVDDAISQLEMCIRLDSCSLHGCYKLLDIYGRQKNIDGLLGVYQKLYEITSEDEHAQKILEILMFKNKNKDAIEFLEKSGYKPDILVELYVVEKRFDNATNLVKRLYDETKNLEYISKIAVIEYESAENKTTKIVSSVSDKFEKSVSDDSDALYLNYYGYLLINHDLDIDKGIKLVKKALESQPDSPYYLDSLAWGLYKQKKCEEAYDIMRKVAEHLNDKEIVDHLKLIKSCLSDTKKKSLK